MNSKPENSVFSKFKAISLEMILCFFLKKKAEYTVQILLLPIFYLSTI